LALVIVATGRSSLKTVGASWLAAGIAALMLVMLGVGLLLGYRFALGGATGTPSVTASAPLTIDRPETRALIDRVGAIHGRLSRLESEASQLARRLGKPDPEATAADQGGPLIPAWRVPLGNIGPLASARQLGRGVAQLEAQTAGLERRLSRMRTMATAGDLRSMALPNLHPIAGGRLTSGFGLRRDPLTGRLARHSGLDFAAPAGTPILASAGGRVRTAGRRGPYGNVVEIDHGNGLVTRYAHASRLYVRTGDVVVPQQKIAAVGSTGRSTGPHLHFEVIDRGRHVEPRRYLYP
jgi:murein DD-endopeptidase MepM/ murein hydrolase activator NlpD